MSEYLSKFNQYKKSIVGLGILEKDDEAIWFANNKTIKILMKID